jgi:hypothetical protein
MRALDISAGIVEQRYGLGTISPLSDDESDALKKKLDAAPADGKVAIFRQLRNGFSDDRVRAIDAQLAGKKESITALSMVLSMEAPRAAIMDQPTKATWSTTPRSQTQLWQPMPPHHGKPKT